MRQLALDIGLNAGPTLANFFPGPNEAAWKHLTLWLGNQSVPSSRSPVPTYLSGPTGSGKSHLLRAVQSGLSSHGQLAGWLDASIVDPSAFDERWSAVLMDDVHRYSAVQQQAAFNWFVNAQTQHIVVMATGDVAAAHLKLREDLRSRLAWGHAFTLQTMSDDERRSVLRQQADARGIFLSDEVMNFMLSRFSRDLGHLIQLLNQLDGYALQTQRTVTIPLLKAMLEES